MPASKIGFVVVLSAIAFAASLTAGPADAAAAPGQTKAKVSAAPSPGAWVKRLTVSGSPVTDSQGNVWSPATGVSGGAESVAVAGIGSTGSPQLYQPIRIGITLWHVTVPAAGEYAVNLLISDTTGDAPGARVFSVSATDGHSVTPLATNIDIVRAEGGWRPFHVTGVVPINGTSLTLKFTASVGKAIASALEVASYGPIAARTTILDDTFYGPAGSQPNPSLWNYTSGSGYEGSAGVEDYTASRTNSALDGHGDLAIRAIRANNGTSTYTSAELTTDGTFTFGFGTVSAVMQTPAGPGMWPGFWAKGTDESSVNWPVCGELDIMEGLYGIHGADDVSGHVHTLGNSSDPRGGSLNQPIASLGLDANAGVNVSTGFHTYSMRYLPGSVTFSFDGKPYFTAAPEDLARGESWPFYGGPNYLLIDLAVGDTGFTGTPPSEPLGSAHTLLIKSIIATN